MNDELIQMIDHLSMRIDAGDGQIALAQSISMSLLKHLVAKEIISRDEMGDILFEAFTQTSGGEAVREQVEILIGALLDPKH